MNTWQAAKQLWAQRPGDSGIRGLSARSAWAARLPGNISLILHAADMMESARCNRSGLNLKNAECSLARMCLFFSAVLGAGIGHCALLSFEGHGPNILAWILLLALACSLRGMARWHAGDRETLRAGAEAIEDRARAMVARALVLDELSTLDATSGHAARSAQTPRL